MKRRQFIKTATAGTLAVHLIPVHSFSIQASPKSDVVRVVNGEPAQLLRSALTALGGMSNFISNGDIVVVKPNIGWARAPEFAANTNPDLVGEVVTLCYEAGAKEVKIFDRTCNDPRRCYYTSQIEEKADRAGADVSQIRKNKYATIKLKDGQILREWDIYEEYLEADKVINLPVAKHHSLCHVSLGLKNLMGVMGGNRGSLHSGFDQKLADITAEILPTLTIIDAYRVLMRNGPTGGNLADVELKKTIIASSCCVSADIAGLDLFSLDLSQVGHINEMVKRGHHKFDANNLNIAEIDLAG
jgi:uncharacterized protein (DUF362 family)